MPELRKMLGRVDTPEIVILMRLIETQSKTTIANWCVNYAEKYYLPIYEKAFKNDFRPRSALTAARDWLNGKIKLPEVKKTILYECHAAAKEAENAPAAQAAARAAGQAASSVHAATHALGVAFYGAAAAAYDKAGLNAARDVYDKIAAEEFKRIEQSFRTVMAENEPNPAKCNWHC